MKINICLCGCLIMIKCEFHHCKERVKTRTIEISIREPVGNIDDIKSFKISKTCSVWFVLILGRMVNVSSVHGRYAMPCCSSYNMSKYGVETMSDSLRLEMVKFGVGVSIVEPGWFDAATSCSSVEMVHGLWFIVSVEQFPHISSTDLKCYINQEITFEFSTIMINLS